MKKAIYKLLTLSLAVVLITGCSFFEDFGDTNVNPGATPNPNTAALLTNALTGLSSTWAGPALYCQYFSETQYPDFSQYASNAASPMGTYAGVLYDLENIILTNNNEALKAEAALNGANENQIAIARILKAYYFWTLTDRWGDIPYSTALKGDPNVTYDTQESIYKDLIKELTESIDQMVTTGSPIKGDIAYSGNMANWKKLANSMRMLMALRLSKRYPGASEYAATEFKAALNNSAGHISSNADNFKLVFPGGAFKNPFFNMYDGRKDYGESKTMTDTLSSLANDARLSVFGATETGAPSTLGVPYGWKRNDITTWTGANPNYTYVFDPDYREATDPLFIVKASSLLLARAEAAKLGWTAEGANVEVLYQDGIKASYTQWGLPEPDASYFSSPNVDLLGDAKDLRKIQMQQWVAYFPDGLQGWSNWRRTGVPALLPARDATNSPQFSIPRRYKYGSTDYSLTKAAVEEAVDRLEPDGKDEMYARVWWDKQ